MEAILGSLSVILAIVAWVLSIFVAIKIARGRYERQTMSTELNDKVLLAFAIGKVCSLGRELEQAKETIERLIGEEQV